MGKVCRFSNRVYKDTIENSNVNTVTDIVNSFNDAKIYSYKHLIGEEYFAEEFEQSMHMEVKDNFKFNDYFANSAVQEAKASLKSNKEVNHLNIEKLEANIKHRQKKLKDTQRQLDHKLKIHASIIRISKAKKNNKKPPKLYTYKGAREFCANPDKQIYAVRCKKYTRVYYNLYDFEHMYLVPKIKQLKNKISMIKYGIARKEQKLIFLKSKVKFSCFGGKLFKQQHTIDEYKSNHSLWKEKFYRARHWKMQISGRLDAKGGNFVFKYNPDAKLLSMMTSQGEKIEFPDVYFPYGQDDVNYAVTRQGNERRAVAWCIEDHGDYYIFKCTVELSKKELNYSKADGVVSLDINYDNLSWTNLDSCGNLLEHGAVHFDIQGKTSGEISKIIEDAVNQFTEVASDIKKPIVRENLDTDASKAALIYGNKKCNYKLSRFAYNKITTALDSKAYKEGIGVFKVNPAYTSQIGKMKYMKPKGLSIHTAAAYAIGRRGLGLKETVPPDYKKLLTEDQIKRHHWSQWSALTRKFKDVKVHEFYTQNITI